MELFPIGSDWYQFRDEDLILRYGTILKKEPGVRLIPGKSLEVHSSHLPLLPGYDKFTPPDCHVPGKFSFAKEWTDNLWSWQVEGSKQILSRRGTLLCDGLGTGKTRTTINSLEFPAAVVCPNSALESVWGDELKDAGLNYRILSGRKIDLTVFDDADDIDVWVMPYSIIHRWLPFFSEVGYGPTIKTLVGDEAHELQNRKGKVAQAWLCINPDRVIILTATPIRNRLRSLWSLLNAVAPNAFGNYWEFRVSYCAAKEGEYGWIDGRPDDLTIQRLAKRLGSLVIKRSREDVGQIVVPHTREVIQIETTPEERIDTLHGASQETIGELWFNAGTKLNAGQLALKAKLRKSFGLLKAQKALLDIRDSLAKHKRVIAWVWHKDVAKLIEESLSDDVDIDVILGSTTKKKRDKILHDWKYGEVKPNKPKLLIASIGALSSAVNLITCGCAMFIEQDWAPLHMIQAEKRTHRAGQKNDKCVTFYYTIGHNTIDEKITKVLVEKAEEDERIFGADGRGDQMRLILGASKQDSDEDFMAKALERMYGTKIKR